MNIEQATKEVEALLHKYRQDEDRSERAKTELVCWNTSAYPGVGLRISEISFSDDDGAGRAWGSSLMQSDREAAAACFCAERSIIARYMQPYFPSEFTPDDLRSADYDLLHTVFDKETAERFYAGG